LRNDLRSSLYGALRGRTCLVGVGNTLLGDDGLGVRLAEAVQRRAAVPVVMAGTAPENCLQALLSGEFQTVLFLDAVELPGEPGSAVLLASDQMKNRYPQISTHKFSLGTLASLLESQTGAKVWLLGVKPASLQPSERLTEAVAKSLEILNEVLCEVLTKPDKTPKTSSRTMPGPAPGLGPAPGPSQELSAGSSLLVGMDAGPGRVIKGSLR
jgi:hydrogenase maturation protease